MSDPRLEKLAVWQQSLEALLSGFEGESLPAPQVMESLWRRCQEAFDRLREVSEELAKEPLPEDFRPRIEEAMKLQAVVSSVASRSREELSGELEKLSGARSRLASLARPGATGDSVDVSG